MKSGKLFFPLFSISYCQQIWLCFIYYCSIFRGSTSLNIKENISYSHTRLSMQNPGSSCTCSCWPVDDHILSMWPEYTANLNANKWWCAFVPFHLSKNRLRTVFLEGTSEPSSFSCFVTVFRARLITVFTCFLNFRLSMNTSVRVFRISSSSAVMEVAPFGMIGDSETSVDWASSSI